MLLNLACEPGKPHMIQISGDTYPLRDYLGVRGLAAKFDKRSKRWLFPLCVDTIPDLLNLPNRLPADVEVHYDRQLLGYIHGIQKARPPERTKELDPPPPIHELMAHQRESVSVYRQVQHFADLSQPGTGKTRVAICRALEKDVWPILIVCPKSIINVVWGRQLREYVDADQVILLDRTTAKNRQLLEEGKARGAPCYLVVVNYEAVPLLLPELKRCFFKAIILDESTKIKNPKAKRSKAVMSLRDGALSRQIMTGTYAPNGIQDVFNQFRFLNPFLFGENFSRFQDRYLHKIQQDRIQFFVPKAGAAKLIQQRVALVSVQHMKKDCVDLPPLIEEVRHVELPAKAARVYRELRDECIAELEDARDQHGNTVSMTVLGSLIVTKLTRLRQIAAGFLYDDVHGHVVIHDAKVREVRAILDEIGDQQLIVFTHHRVVTETLAEALADAGITAAAYYGGMSNKKKDEVIEGLEAGKIQVLVANVMSASLGLNLQFISYAAYYEYDYGLEAFLQSMDRIIRIGQKNKMTIFHLRAVGTIDEYIYKKLVQKEDLQHSLNINELIHGLKGVA